MNTADTKIFLDQLKFPEGLRWRHDDLWFCDLWDHKVYCFDHLGNMLKELKFDDQPVGLGWLSDNRLLITTLFDRKLWQYYDNNLSVFIDLASTAPGYAHDFTVSKNDMIYISCSGFYPCYKVVPKKSYILMVSDNLNVQVAASNIGYPNGIIITPNGKHLIVAETFASKLTIFDIASDFTLVNKRAWFEFDNLGFQVDFDKHGIPKNTNRHYPDGICYDASRDAVWVASPGMLEVICVNQHNQVLETIKTQSYPFDCILGGKDNSILYVATSDAETDKRSGKIEYMVL